MKTEDYNRLYYANNRKRILEQKKEYQRRNRKKLNLKNRRYYHTNEEFRKRQRERMRKYKRAWRMMNVYSLTEEQFEAMKVRQDNKCAICGTNNWGNKKIPSIDHDHKTGKVRGLLCHQCNQALGLMGDSSERLRAAAIYLEVTK